MPEYSQDDRETCFRCGTFASGCFIAFDGNIISCSNDAESSNLLGNIVSSDYASVAKTKSVLMMSRIGFDICRKCTDDYRWYTLWNGSHKKSTIVREGHKNDDVN
ncbi:hypothetical protein [Methanomethylovorans sp.]|uniref:hypothetical protein n=1 Tax=Methanomethylovorans sp. TaxID=2758717 RepID=UPI00351CA42C